jgi:hypothetical protein
MRIATLQHVNRVIEFRKFVMEIVMIDLHVSPFNDNSAQKAAKD